MLDSKPLAQKSKQQYNLSHRSVCKYIAIKLLKAYMENLYNRAYSEPKVNTKIMVFYPQQTGLKIKAAR